VQPERAALGRADGQVGRDDIEMGAEEYPGLAPICEDIRPAFAQGKDMHLGT